MAPLCLSLVTELRCAGLLPSQSVTLLAVDCIFIFPAFFLGFVLIRNYDRGRLYPFLLFGQGLFVVLLGVLDFTSKFATGRLSLNGYAAFDRAVGVLSVLPLLFSLLYLWVLTKLSLRIFIQASIVWHTLFGLVPLIGGLNLLASLLGLVYGFFASTGASDESGRPAPGSPRRAVRFTDNSAEIISRQLAQAELAFLLIFQTVVVLALLRRISVRNCAYSPSSLRRGSLVSDDPASPGGYRMGRAPSPRSSPSQSTIDAPPLALPLVCLGLFFGIVETGVGFAQPQVFSLVLARKILALVFYVCLVLAATAGLRMMAALQARQDPVGVKLRIGNPRGFQHLGTGDPSGVSVGDTVNMLQNPLRAAAVSFTKPWQSRLVDTDRARFGDRSERLHEVKAKSFASSFDAGPRVVVRKSIYGVPSLHMREFSDLDFGAVAIPQSWRLSRSSSGSRLSGDERLVDPIGGRYRAMRRASILGKSAPAFGHAYVGEKGQVKYREYPSVTTKVDSSVHPRSPESSRTGNGISIRTRPDSETDVTLLSTSTDRSPKVWHDSNQTSQRLIAQDPNNISRRDAPLPNLPSQGLGSRNSAISGSLSRSFVFPKPVRSNEPDTASAPADSMNTGSKLSRKPSSRRKQPPAIEETAERTISAADNVNTGLRASGASNSESAAILFLPIGDSTLVRKRRSTISGTGQTATGNAGRHRSRLSFSIQVPRPVPQSDQISGERDRTSGRRSFFWMTSSPVPSDLDEYGHSRGRPQIAERVARLETAHEREQLRRLGVNSSNSSLESHSVPEAEVGVAHGGDTPPGAFVAHVDPGSPPRIDKDAGVLLEARGRFYNSIDVHSSLFDRFRTSSASSISLAGPDHHEEQQQIHQREASDSSLGSSYRSRDDSSYNSSAILRSSLFSSSGPRRRRESDRDEGGYWHYYGDSVGSGTLSRDTSQSSQSPRMVLKRIGAERKGTLESSPAGSQPPYTPVSSSAGGRSGQGRGWSSSGVERTYRMSVVPSLLEMDMSAPGSVGGEGGKMVAGGHRRGGSSASRGGSGASLTSLGGIRQSVRASGGWREDGPLPPQGMREMSVAYAI